MRQKQPNIDRKRTRVDPFADVYDSDIVPLLELDTQGQLYARTIMEDLMETYPDRFFWSQLRTLERRVKEWREEHGLGPEAFIPQDHLPGLEAQVDCTNATSLGVLIRGERYSHKLALFVLSYSGARYAHPATRETLPAMLRLIQAAVQKFGGAPAAIRSDGVPSCVQNGKPITGYQEFLRHYGMRASVITPYRPHENGIVEHGNFRLKNAITQLLILRGNRDFGSVEEYAAFVQTVVDRYNQRPEIADKLDLEHSHLRPLPAEPAAIYETATPVVDKFSLVQVKGNKYSVPNRFIGQKLSVRLYDERLEIYHQDALVAFPDRLHGRGMIKVHYPHVIRWLALKPGAFANCVYRDQLFPTETFREAYAALRQRAGSRADATYLHILRLAAVAEEAEVEAALALLLEDGVTFDETHVWQIMGPPGARMPSMPGYQIHMDFPKAA